MVWIAWILTSLFLMVGWAGTLVPLFPGTAVILCGAILNRILLGSERGAGWWTVGWLAALMLVSIAVDLASGALGAKRYGATRWGAIGGLLGAVAGMFFGLPGFFIGPIAGALAGELLAGRGILPAGRSSWGTLLGMAAGRVANFAIGTAMVAWFLIAAIARGG